MTVDQPPVQPMPQAIGETTCPVYPKLIGSVTVSFRVAIDGTVEDIAVTGSSGDDLTDKDAADCVRGWRYAPILVDGKPVEVPWSAHIAWHNSLEWMPLNATRFDKLCDGVPIPPPTEANEENAEKGPVLLFRVSAQGAVKDAFVARTSGSAAFDAMALECTANWIYRPAIPNGRAAEVPWSASLAWSPSLRSFHTNDGLHFNHASVCDDTVYPPRTGEGVTVLGYTIANRGAVDGIRVVRSSGTPGLDAAAAACAKTWHYSEPKFNDPKFSEPWGAEIFFRNGHIFVLQMADPS